MSKPNRPNSMVEQAHVPAVVVGVELNGLGVVRSLARAGISVIAVDDDLTRPGMSCRYGRKHRVRALHGDMLIDDLVTLARSLPERPVLFLTQEAAVQTVAGRRDELAQWYHLTLGDTACIDLLTDKEGFRKIAEQHDFCVPKSLHVTAEETLLEVQDMRFPVVVKPARRDAAYGRYFEKAYRVENAQDLDDLCRTILPICPDLMVQDWVEGGDADIYFCLQYVDQEGSAAASFTGRKIRAWPPQTGGTASCTAAAPEVDALLAAETTRFFKAAGFTGMGSMEYKKDAATGRFYLIEPTVGRTDYQEEVATLNGVNIPQAAWCEAVGAEIPPQKADRDSDLTVWRNTSIDRRSAELQNQRCGGGELDSGKVVDGWWRWYDPMPWLALTARGMGPAVRTRMKKLAITNGSAR